MKNLKFLIDLYRKSLSRYLFFRFIKYILLYIFQKAHKLKSLYVKNNLSGSYTWVALSDIRDINSKLSLLPEEIIHLHAPFFSGLGAEHAAERTPSRQIVFPEIALCTLKGANVVGGVDFIFFNQHAIHHDLYLPTEHSYPAENLGILKPNKKDKGIVDLWLTTQSSNIPTALSLIGQCSANYAHWLTETLPKLAIIDSTSRFDNVPLLIDEGLHSNILESLHLINKKKRPIITIQKWHAARVNTLLTVSSPGYERYSAHGLLGKEPPPFVNKFSKAALTLLRDTVVSSITKDSTSKGSKKIYLARSKSSKNLRQIRNMDDIEFFLDSHDIKRIQSDEATFVEQVKACMSADLIVCPIGAALTNMIFAPTGCKIICLSPYYEDANYFYYANLAATLGHEIHFVLGEQTKNANHPMHRDYSIDIELLRAHF